MPRTTSAGLLSALLTMAASTTVASSEELPVLEQTAKFERATDPGRGASEPAIVEGFTVGCGLGDDPLPGTEQLPPGVERVRGTSPIPGPYTGRVWIIDSGIAGDFDGSELNVDRTESVECTPAMCQNRGANTAKMDKVGHGTMIAGIIGAMDDGDGLIGVAPGVSLIAVQIFKGNRPNINLKTAKRAIQYVADAIDGAQPGDVVNISWGVRWNIDIADDLNQMEQLLKDMADRGVKIAVAAGNFGQSGYVQTVSPARKGAYRRMNAGAIVTVSAVSSSKLATGDWRDIFWPGSLFGNGVKASSTAKYYLGPPDFAEPGVDITSLWPGGFINTCTGTSFAAAHMAGILAKEIPDPVEVAGDVVSAEGDPSADHPVLGYDPEKEDPIGIYTP